MTIEDNARTPHEDKRSGISLTEEELQKRIDQRHLKIFELASTIQKELDNLQDDWGARIFHALNFEEGTEPTPEALKALWNVVIQWRDKYKVNDPDDLVVVEPTNESLPKLAYALLNITGCWEPPEEPAA
jgi:hypothetical protein